MSKAAIAINEWKLPIFERHLKQAGYTFEKGPGLSVDALILVVNTSNINALEAVVRAANDEANGQGSKQ